MTSAIANHTTAVDPHPGYLTQTEGDGLYRRSAVALTDADIPAAIARDAEVTSAIANHAAAIDPHPNYLTQMDRSYVKLAVFQAQIAPLGLETTIFQASLSPTDVAGANCYIQQSIENDEVRIIAMGDSGWSGGLPIRFSSNYITIPPLQTHNWSGRQ